MVNLKNNLYYNEREFESEGYIQYDNGYIAVRVDESLIAFYDSEDKKVAELVTANGMEYLINADEIVGCGEKAEVYYSVKSKVVVVILKLKNDNFYVDI